MTGPIQSEISFSQLLAEVDNGNVTDVEISGDSISGHFSDGRGFSTFAPSFICITSVKQYFTARSKICFFEN